MTRNRTIVTACVVAALALVGGLILLRRGGDANADATPTAEVTVAQVRSQMVADVTTAYGVVQADPAVRGAWAVIPSWRGVAAGQN